MKQITEIRPIYYLYGEERRLMMDAIQTIKKRVLPEGMEDFNYEQYAGNVISPQDLTAAAMSLPFMSDYRMIVVEQPIPFLSIAKSDKNGQKALESLMEYVAQPNPQCVLVLCGEKELGKNPLAECLKEHAEVIECSPLSGRALQNWVKEYVEEQGLQIDGRALDLLTSNQGFSLEMFQTELDKLIAYAYGQEKITVDMVQLMTTKTVESSVFDLTDALAARNGAKALDTLHRLVHDDKIHVGIIASTLLTHFERLLIAKDLSSKGYDVAAIQSKAGIKSPYAVKKSLGQCKAFTEEYLEKAIEGLLQVVLDATSGIQTHEQALERWMIMLCD